MANELTTTEGWTYSKNGRKRSVTVATVQHTVAGNQVVDSTQTIGFAAHEAIALGDVTTFGFATFENLEDAGGNFVLIGIDEAAVFHPFLKLEPGEKATVWLYEAPYAQADTAAVLLDYVIADR